MNAVIEFAIALDRRRVFQALGKEGRGALNEATPDLRKLLVTRYSHSLAEFLNRAQRVDLEAICEHCKLSSKGAVGELRARLWVHGAALEAGGPDHLGSRYQPTPIVLGSRLVFQGELRGQCPRAEGWPRPVPPMVREDPAAREPDTLEELLANADRLLGLRMGGRGPDKGIYGTRIAALLGVGERGLAEADWRGDVEIKTVPVIPDRAGWWRVKEDPAISMENVDPRIKLRRVLWIVRVEGRGDSPILSWYYQEWDDEVERLAQRYLHQRPKGPAGTDKRGWYLHKRFFLHSGFLKSLNG